MGIQEQILINILIVFALIGVFYAAGQFMTNTASEYLKNGDIAEAENSYKTQLIFRPLDGDVYLGLAECMRAKQEDTQAVIELLEKSYSLDIFEPEYLQAMVEYYTEKGQYKKAYDIIDKIISIDPLNYVNYTLAINTQKLMYKARIVDAEGYTGASEEIIRKAEKANQKVNPLSRYIKKQSFINIEYLKSRLVLDE